MQRRVTVPLPLGCFFHKKRLDSVAFPAAADAVALNPRGLVIAAEAYAANRRFVDDHYDELDPTPAVSPGNQVRMTVPSWISLASAPSGMVEPTGSRVLAD